MSAANGRRAGVMLALVLVIALVAAAGVGWYLKVGQWRETTEDAYVGGNLVLVSPQIDGTVVWINGYLNDYVEAGQVLIRLRENEPRNALEQRKNELALAVKEVASLRAKARRYESEIEERRAAYRKAQEEFERRQRLAKVKMVSVEELQDARSRNDETRSALETAQRRLEETRLRAGSMPIPEHPYVKLAVARMGRDYAVWQKRTIIAPVSGHIAKRNVQPGQRIKTGDPLMAISQLDAIWADANFKETQLRHVHIGQRVEIESDIYGDDVKLEGRVIGIGSGTGAVFSLLPPQNATGNWIKIVQRVPVRIAFNGDSLRQHPLPLGASLRVTVDTTDRSGDKLSRKPNTAAIDETRVYEVFTEGFDELVTSIINANLPPDEPRIGEAPAIAAAPAAAVPAPATGATGTAQ